MSGRVQPILLVLLLALGVAAAWFLFLRDDGGEGESDLRGDSHEEGGAGGDTDLMRAGQLRGLVAELFYAANPKAYRAHLQIRVDAAALPEGEAGVPAIYEIEIRYDDMEPPLTDIEPVGLVPDGWNERGIEGGHRFFTISDPLPLKGRVAQWQFGFNTATEGVPGPRLKKGRIRFLNREGGLIGVQPLVIK